MNSLIFIVVMSAIAVVLCFIFAIALGRGIDDKNLRRV